MDLLRERRDKVMLGFFELRMFGVCRYEAAEVGLEFDGMSAEEMRAWLMGGLEFFRDAFGFLPHCVSIGDAGRRGDEQVKPLE